MEINQLSSACTSPRTISWPSSCARVSVRGQHGLTRVLFSHASSLEKLFSQALGSPNPYVTSASAGDDVEIFVDVEQIFCEAKDAGSFGKTLCCGSKIPANDMGLAPFVLSTACSEGAPVASKKSSRNRKRLLRCAQLQWIGCSPLTSGVLQLYIRLRHRLGARFFSFPT